MEPVRPGGPPGVPPTGDRRPNLRTQGRKNHHEPRPDRRSTRRVRNPQGFVPRAHRLHAPWDIVRGLGGIYGPNTGTCFGSTRQTDIEHMVATSEAYDSGLCRADRATKRRFAEDLRNLTLASPRVNRHQKSGKDAGEWLPARNRCWFAGRVLEVKRAYRLTVDRREAAALGRILSQCYGTEMELIACTAPSTGAREAGASAPARNDALARYDDNGNGRITCREARWHGITPVPRSHPAYRYMRDRRRRRLRVANSPRPVTALRAPDPNPTTSPGSAPHPLRLPMAAARPPTLPRTGRPCILAV